VFYAALFTVLAGYLTFAAYPYFQLLPVLEWFSAALILSAAAFWYEAFRAWRSAPSP
jgi:hypothetical protein